MAKYDYDIVIIGGGAAGLTVASGAAQLGAKTLLIEKEEELGGDCLHYGCVPSKTLISSAKHYYELHNTVKYGLPEISVPAVNFKMIAGRIARVISEIQKHDSVVRFNRLGAEIRFGSPIFLDEHSLHCDGKKITAKKIVITSGSSAAIPLIPGLLETEFITNREIFSLNYLPKSLIVLGAGAIAVEMAQAFSRLGSKVTVIQRSDQILSKEDRDLADSIMNTMSEEGVRFYLQSQVQSVEKTTNCKKVSLKSAGAEHIVEAEEILVALGRKSNTEGLELEKAGVSYSAKGIDVDHRLRTSQKHIFAAGDVTGKYQFTHCAGYEGGIVVTNAIFNIPRKAKYTWMPWCTYTSPELASIGLNEKRAKALGVEYTVLKERFTGNDRALAEEKGLGEIKLLLTTKGKPLGVQILGAHGGDLLAEWVAVVNGDMKLSHLAGSVHPYPTFAEINKKVAGSFFASRIFSQRTRKILTTLFGYQGSSV